MTEETIDPTLPEHAPEEPAPEVESPAEPIEPRAPEAPPVEAAAEEPAATPEEAPPEADPLAETMDLEATVNLSSDSPILEALQARMEASSSAVSDVTRAHLKGLLEALVFASDHPQKANDLAKAASANVKEVRELLADLKTEYQPRGIQLDEVAGGWIFRTSSTYAPFVRDLTKQKPVRLSRAQVETLAILAYRQPVTRPEIDDIRGVDSGPVLKVLLERDLVRILGKKDEPGRPMIYGTTTAFLEFFGLKSLKDLPTLREFTELSEDSRRVAERELGEVLEGAQPEPVAETGAAPEPVATDDAGVAADARAYEEDPVHDTTPPPGTDPALPSEASSAPREDEHEHQGETHEPEPSAPAEE